MCSMSHPNRMEYMTKQQAQEWGRAANREAIFDFLRETVHKLDAIEGSSQFSEDGEAAASDGIRDAAEMLRGVLAQEFATTL